MKWVVVALALLDAGYMTFDGARALLVGDYLTPRSGPYAGQLGPWTHVVSAIGLAPRSTLMKCIFLGQGLLWLAITAAFAMGARWAYWAMLAVTVASAWNLFLGTAFALVITTLLLTPWVRQAFP